MARSDVAEGARGFEHDVAERALANAFCVFGQQEPVAVNGRLDASVLWSRDDSARRLECVANHAGQLGMMLLWTA